MAARPSVTVKIASYATGVPRSTIYDWARKGRIKSYRRAWAPGMPERLEVDMASLVAAAMRDGRIAWAGPAPDGTIRKHCCDRGHEVRSLWFFKIPAEIIILHPPWTPAS